MVLELEDDSQNENLKQEQMNIIQQALEQLSPQRRKVFEMKVSGKYSNQEIADKLNLSINTIKFQYSQSLSRFARQWESLAYCCCIVLYNVILSLFADMERSFELTRFNVACIILFCNSVYY